MTSSKVLNQILSTDLSKAFDSLHPSLMISRLEHNKTESNIPLHFQGNTIESSECLKLLGVTIDEQLNFNTHINEICKKASQKVDVMLRLKKLIPANAKLTLYKSAILPYLTPT